jgi:hypothetical protein
MAIAARVVGGRLESAVGTAVKVAAERRYPARNEIASDGHLAFFQGVDLAIVLDVAAKDIHHIEHRTHHRHTRRASGTR